MSTKREEMANAAMGEGCLGRAKDDELIFVLREHDPSFSAMVAAWAFGRTQMIMRGLKPSSDMASVREALALAELAEKRRKEAAKPSEGSGAGEQSIYSTVEKRK